MSKQHNPYESLMHTIALEQGINFDLWQDQIQLESSFNPNAVSPTGPRGLGQFTKATGNAYGLKTDADFFDPEKSLRASARYMADNVRDSNGDELRALLLYNQGAGPNGRPQLAAYDRGEFSGIGKEGLDYMRRLSTHAQGGNAGFHQFAGVTQNTENSQPSQAYALEREYTAEQQQLIDRAMDTSQPLSIPQPLIGTPEGGKGTGMGKFVADGSDIGTGSDALQRTDTGRSTTIQEQFYNKEQRITPDGSFGAFEGTGRAANAALETSALGVGFRMESSQVDDEQGGGFQRLARHFLTSSPRKSSEWTGADVDIIMDKHGIAPDYVSLVLRGSREDMDMNIAMAKRNMELHGEAPAKHFQEVDGRPREVNAYTESDRAVFDHVWTTYYEQAVA